MTDYDVFEVNRTLQDHMWNLKNLYSDGTNMTPEKKATIDGMLNVMFFEALSTKPCSLDDVLFLFYNWRNSGVNNRTSKFIKAVVAEVKKLNEVVK